MKLLLSLLMLLTIANAQDKLETAKTSCMQQSLYPNKTLDEQKKILIEKAKQESLEELYGTLISSSTDIKNGKLISDSIKSRAVGAVRVNGNPSFYNGKNLGEICTDVNVYITKQDLEKYSPKKVSLTHYCFNNPAVAMKDIKQEAKYGAYKEIIAKYKPSMKVTGKKAEQFIHGFTISNDKFDFDTASYCFNAVGTILPYELEMNSGIKESSNINKKEDKTAHSCQEVITIFPESTSGYYDIYINDKKYNVYCNMDIDNGGWTRVWESVESNYNTKNFFYDLPIEFIKHAKETIIGFSNRNRLESAYKFKVPKEWKDNHPLSFSNGIARVDTVDLFNGKKYYDRTLYFGYENFSSTCTDDFKGGSWGKLCIGNTESPFFTSFAHTEADHCNTARQSYDSVQCQGRKFNIYMK